MLTPQNGATRERVDFSKIKTTIPIPNLIEVQKKSYERFLQMDLLPSERDDTGLESVFKSVFPISDFRGLSQLEFVDYAIGNWECKCGNLKGLHHLRSTCRNPACGATIKTDPFHLGDVLCHRCGTFNKNIVTFCNRCGDPVGLQLKYDVPECEERGMTYAAPLKVTIRLTVFDKDPETGNKTIRDIKEQEVFFGEIPLMTDNGTFIINGTERVIVSQLHRSPGVFFDHDKGKTHSSGKLLYSARVIPYRGSWLDFEFDHKDILYVRIDRRRKLHATVLLRALGYSTEELLNYFYDTETIHFEPSKKYSRQVNYELLVGQRATRDIKHPKTKEVLVKKNRKFTKGAIRKLQESGVDQLPIDLDELVGKVSAKDVIDESTGEVLLQCNEELNEAKLDELRDRGVEKVEVLFIDNLNVGPYLRNTLLADKLQGPDEAVMEIYRRLRPGDQPALDSAQTLFQNLFFNAERYDLSRVGRLKLNYKFKIDEAIETQILTKRDILETVRYLIELRNGRGVIDDIDHLGNRRVRAVGELMENQYRIGLVRMERAIKERMSMSQEIETLMPHDLINAKPVSAVVKEYFGSSQLSQFMDQTNPLSEVTHKRRLSALGPGGLTRERAGFEVRDVHPTHYGRICPIETPEGPNIGLIASLSTYARVNEFVFIETPYRRAGDGRATEEVSWMSATEEMRHTIAQANAQLDEEG